MTSQFRMLVAVAILVVLSSCAAEINTLNVTEVTGCYEPEIGPYLGDVTLLPSEFRESFAPPPFYQLTKEELEEWSASTDDKGPWLQVVSPEISAPEILQKAGGWRMVERDSIVIQWRDEYNVTEYRLQVKPERLIGQGVSTPHLPDVETTKPKPVNVRRVECPEE